MLIKLNSQITLNESEHLVLFFLFFLLTIREFCGIMLIFIKKKNTPPQPIREVYFPQQKIYKKETINFLISNYRNYPATTVIQILYRGYIHICFNFFSIVVDKFYFISFIFCGEKVNYFLYYCFHFAVLAFLLSVYIITQTK